ncbi:exodeoxyribonuclease VII small subunit [Halalkalibaculum sp. DA3122]|uniref:exodeoxyribonuclease VII small subunit n=1 Tax=unclassified Halalkalibaculum TaxID=2964617 RepID=UPI0037543CDE
MSKKERLSFEEALTRLEEIVSKLEDESVSLEDSIELYEEGITLSNICTKTLEEAELRIEKVHEEHNENNQ